jgi:hypothetical protein
MAVLGREAEPLPYMPKVRAPWALARATSVVTRSDSYKGRLAAREGKSSARTAGMPGTFR